MMKQYIRDENRRKVGLMVAYPDGNKVRIGVSKCHSRLDKFDNEMAHDIAVGRAERGHSIPKLPSKDLSEFWYFVNRCTRYYKDKIFPEWVIL